MVNRLVVVIALTLISVLPARAENMVAAAESLCEKFKGCALEQMGGPDVSPEMRAMMEPMLDNMCASMDARIGPVPTGHELHDPAVACLRSMEKLSCDAMRRSGNGDALTAECEAYEALSQKYEGEQPGTQP